MADTKPIHLKPTTYRQVVAYAKAKGMTLVDAAEAIVNRALARKAAVDKYNAKRG